MTDGLAAITQRAVDATYDAIPHTVTVADAMALDWGAERNLTLRKALGIPNGNGDVCMVNQGGVIQVVTPVRADAKRHAAKLEAVLPTGWTVLMTRRPDRQWLITAHV